MDELPISEVPMPYGEVLKALDDYARAYAAAAVAREREKWQPLIDAATEYSEAQASLVELGDTGNIKAYSKAEDAYYVAKAAILSAIRKGE